MTTKKLNVVKPPKDKFSWTKEILKLEVGDEPIAIEDQYIQKVRERLSRDVKVQAPEREFLRDTDSKPGYLLLSRIA